MEGGGVHCIPSKVRADDFHPSYIRRGISSQAPHPSSIARHTTSTPYHPHPPYRTTNTYTDPAGNRVSIESVPNTEELTHFPGGRKFTLCRGHRLTAVNPIATEHYFQRGKKNYLPSTGRSSLYVWAWLQPSLFEFQPVGLK